MFGKIQGNYFNFFKLNEIRDSKLLKFLYFSVALSFFVTFYGWASASTVTIKNFLSGTHICPPYFPSCGKYYFLDYLPYGYTQGYLYVGLFLVLLWGVYSALKGDWVKAHFALLLAFTWKVVWIFLFTYGVAGNYDYYDLGLAFVILFLTNKEYFAKILFVWFYFLASTIKIDEGWIFGNYFEALITSTPIFPKIFIPYFTNIVILMQILGAWFLLSNNRILQKLAFVYFLLFHIYSGFIVNYRYITISIPALLILFGHLSILENKKFEIMKISQKTLFGYGFLVFLLIGQFIGILIPGNQKKTLEGNFYGLYMFEASHQCVSTIREDRLINDELKSQYFKAENHIANNRCDPYDYWFELKTKCDRDKHKENNLVKIAWTFDHSINGHKYERIVDVENACDLTYKSFGHNEWIKTDGQAEILTNPVYKTGYLAYYNEKLGNVEAHPYVNDRLLKILENFYKLLWLIVFLTVLYKLLSKTFRK